MRSAPARAPSAPRSRSRLASGTSHGADFEIADPTLTYITNAKALASMVVEGEVIRSVLMFD